MKGWFFGILCLFLVGCLQTRETIADGGGERTTLREQMKGLQSQMAQQQMRMDELMAEMRQLNGRVEDVRGQSAVDSQQEVTELKLRLKVYEEALEKLDREVRALKTGKPSAAAPAAPKVPPGDLAAGDFHFERKSWAESIRAYEAYRQKNPQGKNYPKATLRIALAFQSMGMNTEAKAFFQEVASQFPSSEEARIASSRLSHL